ncbi:hypothetical protein BESB_069520 [Besnoitia besnoiti]|uniref:VHS domain-containing protein n=1 Tax=Besnoitia besnoiti TaxID=94643 RepID=A0A2A9MAJ1_BESBE|nr:hypothetical protein BESB_069520 [Besnoitia besnoiti]PFH34919.1 hypothetical protein BESB_069520 [Besnoitia besnoiti]
MEVSSALGAAHPAFFARVGATLSAAAAGESEPALVRALEVIDEVGVSHEKARLLAAIVEEKLRLSSDGPLLLAAIELVAMAVSNLGVDFARALDERFMRTMCKILRMTTLKKSLSRDVKRKINKLLIGSQSTNPGVATDPQLHRLKRKVLYLLQLWHDSFVMQQERLPAIFEAYRKLRAKGVEFPKVDPSMKFMVKNAEESPAFDPSLRTRRSAPSAPSARRPSSFSSSVSSARPIPPLTADEERSVRAALAFMQSARASTSPSTRRRAEACLEAGRPRLQRLVETLSAEDASLSANFSRLCELLDLVDRIDACLGGVQSRAQPAGKEGDATARDATRLRGEEGLQPEARLPSEAAGRPASARASQAFTTNDSGSQRQLHLKPPPPPSSSSSSSSSSVSSSSSSSSLSASSFPLRPPPCSGSAAAACAAPRPPAASPPQTQTRGVDLLELDDAFSFASSPATASASSPQPAASPQPCVPACASAACAAPPGASLDSLDTIFRVSSPPEAASSNLSFSAFPAPAAAPPNATLESLLALNAPAPPNPPRASCTPSFPAHASSSSSSSPSSFSGAGESSEPQRGMSRFDAFNDLVGDLPPPPSLSLFSLPALPASDAAQAPWAPFPSSDPASPAVAVPSASSSLASPSLFPPPPSLSSSSSEIASSLFPSSSSSSSALAASSIPSFSPSSSEIASSPFPSSSSSSALESSFFSSRSSSSSSSALAASSFPSSSSSSSPETAASFFSSSSLSSALGASFFPSCSSSSSSAVESSFFWSSSSSPPEIAPSLFSCSSASSPPSSSSFPPRSASAWLFLPATSAPSATDEWRASQGEPAQEAACGAAQGEEGREGDEKAETPPRAAGGQNASFPAETVTSRALCDPWAPGKACKEPSAPPEQQAPASLGSPPSADASSFPAFAADASALSDPFAECFATSGAPFSFPALSSASSSSSSSSTSPSCASSSSSSFSSSCSPFVSASLDPFAEASASGSSVPLPDEAPATFFSADFSPPCWVSAAPAPAAASATPRTFDFPEDARGDDAEGGDDGRVARLSGKGGASAAAQTEERETLTEAAPETREAAPPSEARLRFPGEENQQEWREEKRANLEQRQAEEAAPTMEASVLIEASAVAAQRGLESSASAAEAGGAALKGDSEDGRAGAAGGEKEEESDDAVERGDDGVLLEELQQQLEEMTQNFGVFDF